MIRDELYWIMIDPNHDVGIFLIDWKGLYHNFRLPVAGQLLVSRKLADFFSSKAGLEFSENNQIK